MSSPESISWNLEEVKVDLMRASRAQRHRGLNHGAKWTAELNFSLKSIKVDTSLIAAEQQPPDVLGEKASGYRDTFVWWNAVPVIQSRPHVISLSSLYNVPSFSPQRTITTIT